MYSRRDFGKLATASLCAAAAAPTTVLFGQQRSLADLSTVRGVRLGIIGASLRGGPAGGRGGAGRAGAPGAPGAAPPSPPPAPPPATPPGIDPIDAFIEDLTTLGIGHVELNSSFGAPALVGAAVGNQAPATRTPEYLASREALRQWRRTATFDQPRQAAAKFKAAGIDLFSSIMTVDDDCTDEEIDYIFRHMQALGVKVFCTNQTRVHMGPRMAPFADRYKISPAFHTHAEADNPDEVASPASLDRLLNMSPQFMVNLDIGHFTAGNQDAVAYIRAHHDRITHLHVKDRKRDKGPSVAWGTGDTPVAECLRLIRDNKWPIACIMERDNRDEQGTTMELTKKYMDYMRQVLES